jgi:hypothetical protein
MMSIHQLQLTGAAILVSCGIKFFLAAPATEPGRSAWEDARMAAVPDNWTQRLASAIAIAVREFAELLRGEPVAAFDVGCFPWHGFVELSLLSLLTAAELDTNPAMLGPRELAAWRYYNFSGGVASWDAAAELGRLMSKAYYSADDSTRAVTSDAGVRHGGRQPGGRGGTGLARAGSTVPGPRRPPGHRREFWPPAA